MQNFLFVVGLYFTLIELELMKLMNGSSYERSDNVYCCIKIFLEFIHRLRLLWLVRWWGPADGVLAPPKSPQHDTNNSIFAFVQWKLTGGQVRPTPCLLFHVHTLHSLQNIWPVTAEGKKVSRPNSWQLHGDKGDHITPTTLQKRIVELPKCNDGRLYRIT